MPAQRLLDVCLRGPGGQWLPTPRAPPGAQLSGLHAQHSLSSSSTPAHSQTRAAAHWPSAAIRYKECTLLVFISCFSLNLTGLLAWLEAPIRLHHPCLALPDTGRIQGDGVRRALLWWWCSPVSPAAGMLSWARRAWLTVSATSHWSALWRGNYHKGPTESGKVQN